MNTDIRQGKAQRKKVATVMLRSRPRAGTHPSQGLIGDWCAYGDVGVFWVLSFQQRQEAQRHKKHVQCHADTLRGTRPGRS